MPSIRISPEVGFKRPEIISTIVVFPDPLFPIIQIHSFLLILKLRF